MQVCMRKTQKIPLFIVRPLGPYSVSISVHLQYVPLLEIP